MAGEATSRMAKHSAATFTKLFTSWSPLKCVKE
jgi:hypothetical protein